MDLVSFEDSLGLKLLGFSQNTHYFYLDNGELRSVNETKSKSKKANWNSLTPDGVMYSAPNLNAYASILFSSYQEAFLIIFKI